MRKRCSTCRKELPVSSFDLHGKDGHQSQCRKCRVAYNRAWRLGPKGKATADRTRGSVRQRNVELCKVHPECAAIDRLEVLRRGDGLCGICGKKVRRRWHMDHIIPVSKGGVHCYLNLQPSHIRCNLRKGNKIAL